MSKDKWLKQQLSLKGIYDYTEEDFNRLKSLFIDNITSLKMDKYLAFDKAFKIVFGRKGNEKS